MAKQIGPVFITGTLGGITFYMQDGVYYARKKSSLSGKRVKKSAAFKRTMDYANMMAAASKIASAVYRLFSRQEREVKMYRAFVGEAMDMLKMGSSKEEVMNTMMQRNENKRTGDKDTRHKEASIHTVHTARSEEQGTKEVLLDAAEIVIKKQESLKHEQPWWTKAIPEADFMPACKHNPDAGLPGKEFSVPWYSSN